MDLLKKFDAVLAHLNSEENELALEFRKELEEFIDEAEDQDLWVACLEGAGVDNWRGYDYAQEAYSEAKGEDE